MNNFGKSLKPVNVDRLIDFVKQEINKPYKPKRTSLKLPEIKTRRKAKKGKVYHKRERDTHGYIVYYDRNRKGWFYRDEEGNRYGIRGSKDKGFSHKKNAIDALQRRWRKDQKKKEPPLPPGNPDPDPGPIRPEPPKITTFQYNELTSGIICGYRRLRYGAETPGSGSAYMKLFGGFEEEWPIVDITQYTKSQIEKKQDHNFIILELLHLLGYEPVYDENNKCIGLEDFEGDANVS